MANWAGRRRRTGKTRSGHSRKRRGARQLAGRWEQLEARELMTLISVSDIDVDESAGAAAFVVRLDQASESVVSVDVHTEDGTALGGQTDYESRQMTIQFEPGTIQRTVTVPLINDTRQESDETLKLKLTQPVGAELEQDQALARIRDDDAIGLTNPRFRTDYQGGTELYAGNLTREISLTSDVTLRYNTLGRGMQVLAAETVVPGDSEVPDRITAAFSIGDLNGPTFEVDPLSYQPGQPIRFASVVDVSSLPAGPHDWRLHVTEEHGDETSTRTLEGRTVVRHTGTSALGRHWSVSGLARLHVQDDWLTLWGGDGSSWVFPRDQTVAAEGGDQDASGTDDELSHGSAPAPPGDTSSSDQPGSTGPGDSTPGTPDGGEVPESGDDGTTDPSNPGTGGGSTDEQPSGSDPAEPQGPEAGSGGSDSGSDSHSSGWGNPLLGELIEHEDGHFTLFVRGGGRREFTPEGLLSRDVDSFGNQTRYKYDAQQRLSELEDQRGRVVRFEYAGQHVQRIIGWRGEATQLSHDDSGNLTEIVLPHGPSDSPPTWRFHYAAPHGLLSTETNPAGEVTAYHYDSSSMLRERIFHDGTRRSITPALAVGLVDANGLGSGTMDPAAVRGLQQDEAGRVTHVRFDAEGRPLEWSDPAGHVYRMERNEWGQPTRTVWPDPDGSGPLEEAITRLVYDEQLNLVQMVLPHLPGEAEPARSWEYEPGFDTPVRYTDELGRVTTRQLDPLSGAVLRLTQVIGQEDSPENDETDDLVHQFTYTPQPADTGEIPGGLASTYVAPDGSITEVRYQEDRSLPGFGFPSVITSAAGTPSAIHEHLTYDSAGILTAHVDAAGNRREYRYDDRGQLVEFVSPDPDGDGPLTSGSVRWVRDAAGRPVQVTFPDGNGLQYLYDARGRVAQTRAMTLGNTETAATLTWQYDPSGQPVATTDHTGRTVHYTHDPLGRVTSVQLPAANGAAAPSYGFEYDVWGNLVREIDPNGLATIHTYDLQSRRIATTLPDPDASGPLEPAMTFWSYDAAGQLIAQQGGDGVRWLWTYDDAGRPVTLTVQHLDSDQDSQEQRQFRREYDRGGRVAATTSPGGERTEYEFDALGRMARLRTGDSQNSTETQFTYDALGNLRTIRDPAGNLTEWVYDGWNRVVLERDTLGDVRTYRYDERGNLAVAGSASGERRLFEYDGRHQLLQETWMSGEDPAAASATYTWQYDTLGRLLSTSDPEGRNTYAWNELNQLVEKHREGPLEYTVEYAYDLAGRRTASILQAGDGGVDVRALERQVAYDGWGRPVGLTQMDSASSPQLAVDVRYDPQGRLAELVRTDGNSALKSERVYDSLGQLESLTHRALDEVLAEYQWGFDLDGRVAWEETASAASAPVRREYDYDAHGQLTRVTEDGQPVEQYTYDLHGNRAEPETVIGANNQLLRDEVYSYEYDAVGRRVARTRLDPASGHDYRTHYDWNGRAQLVRVWVENQQGDLIREVRYEYDAEGRRTGRQVDPDGFGPEAVSREHYIYDRDQLWAIFDDAGQQVRSFLHGPNVDQVLSEQTVSADGQASTHWTLGDPLGTVRDVVTSDGQLVGRRKYDAFGAVLENFDSSHATQLGYTGREWDPLTGLGYHRERYYDPTSRTWMSQDPLGFLGGDTNLTRYVGNDPVNQTDPSGLSGRDWNDVFRAGWNGFLGGFMGGLPKPFVPPVIPTRPPTSLPIIFMPDLGVVPGAGAGAPTPGWWKNIHFTIGGGVSAYGQLPFLEGSISADVDVGVNLGASDPWDVITIGVSLTPSLTLFSMGLAVGWDVHGRVSTAENVGALEGGGSRLGVNAGPYSGHLFSNVDEGSTKAPPAYGIEMGIGLGGLGGIYADRSESLMLHTGPDAPPKVYPNRQRAGNGGQYLNPGP